MELTTNNRAYTAEQLAFIEADIKSNIILKATAGSGKTAVSCERVKYLLANGVSPEKICFFSYTQAATLELKSRLNNDAVKVTTIHAFCLGMLAKMNKFKKIVEIYSFIEWYKEKCKPKYNDSQLVKDKFYDTITSMYEDAQYISSSIAAFKLQNADGIKSRIPKYYLEYKQFTKETKSRDFSDMIVECRDLLKENKWLRMFKNQYDYILVDEFQDTSSIQFEILQSLNAKYYTIIGDISQSIFLYSGANAEKIISMLRKRRDCIDLSLSMNFRSSKAIVEHANNYSDLKAVPFSQEEGKVHKEILLLNDLKAILNKHSEVAILVRTNSAIKEIEKKMLMCKQPMRYFNYLTPQECIDLKKATERPITKKKVKALLPVFKSTDLLLEFIESNSNHATLCTSIHKSKGREFSVTVVVNCVSPEILTYNNFVDLDKETLNKISFNPNGTEPEDFEAKNIFYVSISRAKSELYFLLMDA